jgi:maleylpyruvate isomerase
MDPTSPDVIDAVGAYTERLLGTARALDDPRAPSLCAGWTRGHVLSHVARNADGLTALVRSAVDGTGETMYPSAQVRDDEIDAGADRPLDELVADIERTAAELAAQLPRLRAEHAGTRLERTPGAFLIPAGRIPFMRLRELVFHHVDLDAGFGFADVQPEVVRMLVAHEVQGLRDGDVVPDLTLRTPEGEEWTTGLGTASVTGSAAALLGWLGRGLTGAVAGDPLPGLPTGR